MLIGCLSAALAVAIAPSPWLTPLADAATGPTPSCFQERTETTGDYGQVVGAEEGGSQEDLSGVRSRLYVNDNATCGVISSITAINRFNKTAIEFGVVTGWINCTGTGEPTWIKYPEPTPFALWVLPDGSLHCKSFPNIHPPRGGTATFQVSDANRNGFWGSWYNGQELQPNGVYLQTSKTMGAVNMERESSTDSGSAHFYSIEEHLTSWSSFDNVKVVQPTDPAYQFVRISGHEAKVAKP